MASPRFTPTYRIDPFDLRLFTAVVDEGTITAGARQANLSLAAASARLKNLEHAIGAALLYRAKQGVTLTDAGRTLMRHAGRLLREMEAMHADMAAHAHGVSSTVRLLCNTAAMSEYLPPLLGRFLAAHPDIDIDLRELGSLDVLQAMRQERADIGIVADYVCTEGLLTRVFREDRLVVLLPAVSAGSGEQQIDFCDLLAHSFVGLPAESGLSRFLQSQALRYGRGLHHRVRVRSLDAVVRLVADGAGVAIVPQSAAERLAGARIAIRLLADSWANRRLLLCTASGAEPGLGAAALLAFLADASG